MGEAQFDEMLERTRAELRRRRAELGAPIANVEVALQSYREALDAVVLREFAVRNGLEVSDVADSTEEAARVLREAVLALPELAAHACVVVDEAPASVTVAAGPSVPEAELAPPGAEPAAVAETSELPSPPPSAVTTRRVVIRQPPTLVRDDNPPSDSETRLRAFGSRLDAEGEVLKAEFEAIEFDTLSDAEFSSFATEFAARARLRQEKGLVIAGSEFEVRIIRRLTALAHQRNLPRPVYGLSRSHTGDWEAIAKRARDERERRAAGTTKQATLTHRLPIPSTIGPPPPTAIADAADDDGTDEEPLDLPQLRALAEAAVVVLVGGTVKNEKLVRVRKRTGIEVEWIGLDVGKSAAAVTALAKRIRAGKIGALVLLNGLMDHKQSEPLIAAARDVDLPVAYADKAGKGSLVKAFVELEKRVGERAA